MTSELTQNEQLWLLLRAIAKTNEPPGAVAVSGLVSAIAASIGQAGDTDISDTDWRRLINDVLQCGDEDTVSYWSGDQRAVADTPHKVLIAALGIAATAGNIQSGNRADLDAAQILAVGASAATARIIEQNGPHKHDYRCSNLLAPAASPAAQPLLTVARAYGPYLYDDKGIQWFDAASGMWNVPLGHGHAGVIAGWLAQATQVAAVDPFLATTPVAERTAAQLLEIVGMGDGRAVFSSSGSESIEIALRFGLALERDAQVWSMPGAFHGSTAGAAALSAFRSIRGPLPQRALWAKSCPPSQWTVPGIGFFEPMQVGRGCLEITPEEVSALSVFQKEGGILVADEVATGLGRAAWPLAAPKVGLFPDMYVVGKGLANGVAPLSALIVSRSTIDAIEGLGQVLDFGHTHTNHAVGLAAASAALNALSMLDHSRQAKALRRSFDMRGIPIQGSGFLLTTPGFDVDRAELFRALREARLVSHTPTTMSTVSQLTIAPPLTITSSQIDDLTDRVQVARSALGW